MFDILVYLFERYVHADIFPESDQLARKLSAAGFEDVEISEALEWFSKLRHSVKTRSSCPQPSDQSTRLYAEQEKMQLNPVCRGFLIYLENTGILDAENRELIIELAMTLNDFKITLNRLKVIVLMVLWQQDQPINTLIIDELLSCDDTDPPILQ